MSSTRCALLAGLGLALFGAVNPASASLTAAELATVSVAAKPGDILPVGLPLQDEAARTQPFGHWIGGRPAMLVLADMRCTQLCGPILSIAAHALDGTGLRPGQDFDLLVVGFNPAATTADSAAMRAAQLDGAPALAGGARFLTGTADTVAQLERSLGYTAVYDQEAGRFAHPAQVFVLTPEGRLSRVLDGLTLEPETTRLALVEAGNGRIGTLGDRLHLLCYGLDPASGRFTASALTALRIGAALTLAGLGGMVLVVARRRTPEGNGA